MSKSVFVLFVISSVVLPTYAKVEGETLYKANCVACHGPTGQGDGPAAMAMKDVKPRNFTRDSFKNGDSKEAIMATISEGIAPLMPSWKGQLSPKQIEALAQYIQKLRTQKAPSR